MKIIWLTVAILVAITFMVVLFHQPSQLTNYSSGDALTNKEKIILISETLDSEARLWHSENITRLQKGFILLNNTEISGLKIQSSADGIPIQVLSQERIDSLSLTKPIDFGFFKQVGITGQDRAEVVLVYQWDYCASSDKPIWRGGIVYHFEGRSGEWALNDTCCWEPD
jgi:hypothetical protein